MVGPCHRVDRHVVNEGLGECLDGFQDTGYTTDEAIACRLQAERDPFELEYPGIRHECRNGAGFFAEWDLPVSGVSVKTADKSGATHSMKDVLHIWRRKLVSGRMLIYVTIIDR